MDNGQTGETYHCALRLIWTRLVVDIYQGLSGNIAREICSYIQNHPLLVLDETGVSLYDAVNKRVSGHLVDVPSEIYPPFLLIYLGNKQVFVYKVSKLMQGGHFCTAFLIAPGRETIEFPKSTYERICPGAFYHPSAGVIYLFGGLEAGCSSEKLSLKQGKWRDVGDMHEVRSHFQPCSYGDWVYLCGGGTVSIETFHLLTHQFTVLPILLPEKTESVTVISKGYLCILTPFYLTKVHLKSQFLSYTHRPCGAVWSWSTPVHYGSSVYLFFARLKAVVLQVDLDTGEVRSKAEIRTLRIPKHGLPGDDTLSPFLVVC